MCEYFYGPDPPLYKVLKLTKEIESLLAECISELERDLVYLAVEDVPQVKRLSDLKASLALYRLAKWWIEGDE